MNLIELGLLTWIVTIGFLISAAFWPHGPVGLALVSPIVGASTYVLSGLALFALDGFSTIGSFVLASVVALGVFGTRVARGSAVPSLHDLAVSATYSISGTLVVFLIAGLGSITRLTPDSIVYLTIAGGLERFGEIPNFAPDQILRRQFTTPVLQTGGVVTGLGYFQSLIPLVVGSGFGLMLWLGAKSLVRQSVALPRIAFVLGLVGAFVLSTNQVLYHLFYINGQGTFAALLLTVLGLTWYATATEQWSVAVMAGIAAAAIAPLRAEGIIVVAFFLLPVLVSKSTPVWARWVLVLPSAVTAILWNGVLLPRVLPEGTIELTSAPVLAIAVSAALVLLVVLSQVSVLIRLMRWVPLAALGLLLLYTGARSVRDTTLLYETLSAMGSNIALTGLWATFWWIAPLAVAICVVATTVPYQNRLLWGLGAYPVLLFAFAYLRAGAYRVGPGDSANRMLMHVVFVIGLYLIVALGQLAASVSEEQWSVYRFYTSARDTLLVR